MGKTYAHIDDALGAFIAAQKIFFVATAPAGPGGHVNCSPKGLDSFRVLGPTTVAYVDYVGSGVETIAHLRDNGRITIMMCAFDGPPKILRLQGTGDVVEPGEPEFAALAARFAPARGVRAIVRAQLTRITDSCGYGVPLYQFEADRPQLDAWCARKGEEGLATYQREKNARSIDGLPGLRWTDPEST